MTTPSKTEIARFLKAMDILGRFDAEMRLMRGHGANFDPQEWPDTPDPTVMKVRRWLESLERAGTLDEPYEIWFLRR